MPMSPDARAAAVVARALDIQAAVSIDDDMASLGGWTSLAHVRLVLEIEAEAGRMLTPDEIASIDSVRAVARLLGT